MGRLACRLYCYLFMVCTCTCTMSNCGTVYFMLITYMHRYIKRFPHAFCPVNARCMFPVFLISWCQHIWRLEKTWLCNSIWNLRSKSFYIYCVHCFRQVNFSCLCVKLQKYIILVSQMSWRIEIIVSCFLAIST